MRSVSLLTLTLLIALSSPALAKPKPCLDTANGYLGDALGILEAWKEDAPKDDDRPGTLADLIARLMVPMKQGKVEDREEFVEVWAEDFAKATGIEVEDEFDYAESMSDVDFYHAILEHAVLGGLSGLENPQASFGGSDAEPAGSRRLPKPITLRNLRDLRKITHHLLGLDCMPG